MPAAASKVAAGTGQKAAGAAGKAVTGGGKAAAAASAAVAAAAEWSAGPLVKADLTGPGLRRRRSGRGFRYLAADGAGPAGTEAVARIKALVIPPAWEDVWISPDSLGHIQAVGTDAAGRRQYMYHQLWREQRDQAKFDRVMEFGRALPRLRDVVERQLAGHGLTRDRVLAAAVRLIDLGFFRSGADEYAAENGTYGLATIRREHVTCGKCELTFEYIGKSGKHREQAVADAAVCSVVRSLKRRRSGLEWEDLLVYRSGTRWHNVSAGDINDYLRETTGGEFTAKDFRTWHATVLAAVGLAVSGQAAKESPAARKRAIARVVQEVAGYLGNTPAVARASYIDPRIIELYEQGITISSVLPDLGKGQEFGDVATKGVAERAVLRLLTGDAHRLPLSRQRARKAAWYGGIGTSDHYRSGPGNRDDNHRSGPESRERPQPARTVLH